MRVGLVLLVSLVACASAVRLCSVNADCLATETCLYSTGTCPVPPTTGLTWGKCSPRPQACPRLLQPVCGCDLVTYNNDCLAISNGTSVLHQGDCVGNGERCTPFADDCKSNSTGWFCRTDVGACSSSHGVCVSPPSSCRNATLATVCSCSALQYSSPCQALANLDTIAHAGPCSRNLTCFNTKDCGEPAYYCRYPPGQCTPTGLCRPRPEFCTQQYDPVCSCTGVTYSNACMAGSAGANIWRTGACQ